MTAVVLLVLLAAGWLLSRKWFWEAVGVLVLRSWLHVDHRPRTDATWFRPGTQPLRKLDRPTRWHYQPRALRVAFAWAVLAAVVAAPLGWFFHRGETIGAAVGLAGAGLAIGLLRAGVAGLDRAHRERNVYPLAAVLGPMLRVELGRPAEEWIEVPSNIASREEATVTIHLPQHWQDTPDGRRAVQQAVTGRLSLGDVDSTWTLAGEDPHVVFRRAPRPPALVTLDDVRELLERADPSRPIIGLGVRSVPVSVSYEEDSPHTLISGGTGMGKSVLLRLLCAQGLHKGARALILDPKRISHQWANGLPSVRYLRDTAAIHEGLLWASREVDRRYALIEDGADIDGNADHVDVGGPLFIVVEELNALSGRLAAYWREVKPKGAPATSPAVVAMNDVLSMGRAAQVRVIACGQMMTAVASGGGAARENFANRILGRYTGRAWAMLVPEIGYRRSSRHRGRVQVTLAGEAWETQVVNMSPAEAREWSLSGIVTPFPDPLAEDHDQGEQGSDVTRDVTNVHPIRPAGLAPSTGTEAVTGNRQPATGEPVGGSRPRTVGDLAAALAGPPCTLREAVDAGVLSIAYDAARAAKSRDPEFPKPVGSRGASDLYSPATLARWQANRPGRGGAGVGAAQARSAGA